MGVAEALRPAGGPPTRGRRVRVEEARPLVGPGRPALVGGRLWRHQAAAGPEAALEVKRTPKCTFLPPHPGAVDWGEAE